MKQFYIEINLRSTGSFSTVAFWERPKNLKIENRGFDNIFLNQNLGKGPPGRMYRPEAVNRLPRITLSDIRSINHNYQLLIQSLSISLNLKLIKL